MAEKRFVCVEDFANRAKELLPQEVWEYINCGSDEEITLKDNVQAFQKIKLRPRVFRDVSKRDLSTTLLGERVDLPIGIAPSTMHKQVWPDGEVSTARACREMKTCYVTSLGSSSTFDEICGDCPSSLKWQQIYFLQDRSETARIVEEAEKREYKALLVSVDHAVFARRRPLLREGFVTPSERLAILNEFTSLKEKKSVRELLDPIVTLQGIKWLKSITKLPIVVKGILTPEDAVLAVENGVSAVWVSNQGGRMLDSVSATIDVLPDIVSAVGDKVEVYMDSGIRTGTDVMKALALGARAVFLGRPVLWGLACQGQDGVEAVLKLLREELDIVMALSGCTNIAEIDSSYVIRER